MNILILFSLLTPMSGEPGECPNKDFLKFFFSKNGTVSSSP